MKSTLQSLIVVILAVLACLLMNACNTMRGAGRDVEHVGHAIEHAAS